MSKTYVSNNELEVDTNHTQTQGGEGKGPVRVSVPLYGRKSEGDY